MINSVVLVGRLTKDIELRRTQSGLSVASFTVACDRRLSAEQKNSGTQSADFINCVAWRGSADFLGNYAHKGDTVGVEGRLQTRSYDRDGQRVYVVEVLANSVNLLHSTQTRQQEQTYAPKPTQEPKPQQMSDFDCLPNVDVSPDDLPF
jgi:single-strand binding protein|nr:MAG TPA: Single strand binding protein [Caudoviricetes sp.]